MRNKKHSVQKSICCLFLAAIMSAAMFSGCSAGTDTDGQSTAPATTSQAGASSEPISSAEMADENTRGNTVGNIVNGGRVAQQGGWIYYCYSYSQVTETNEDGSWKSLKISTGLFKSLADGTERTHIVFSSGCRYINTVGDWIYYSDKDGWCIYKIHTDGTEKTQLNDDESSFINVIGEWIYYINSSDGGRIYKMSTDGTEQTPLNDDESAYLNVLDDWIYYTNESDGGCIYKMHTDVT